MTKNYYYDGDRLIAEKWSTGAYLLYHYDETGSPYALTYSATGSGYAKYYFIKNLQGDVLQIRNVNNAVVANYEYDAWGRVVSVKYANGNDINVSNHIGVINPIRYRGYYYDTETGFYYLKSRYYDPAIGRFISADDPSYLGAGNSTLGLNLFAYCLNDPVNMIDSTGRWPKWLNDAANWINDHIVQPVIEFAEDIVEDFNNYDANNQSEDVVFSSNYFSNYKGAFVIKTSFSSSFSFGFIGLSQSQQNSNTLNHEYGHTVQMDNKGIFKYTLDVAVPSVTINILDRMDKLKYDYYGAPWEAEADMLGGVKRTRDNTPWPKGSYNSYFDLIKMFF